MTRIMQLVEQLRWDDHRYYHQCRINQTLHLLSAITFLFAYVALFFDPAVAGLVGWLFGMVTRQSGHIFFEPRGEDRIHHVSYEYKESIKAGYNMNRKAILIGVWLLSAVALKLKPDLFGVFSSAQVSQGYWHCLGLTWLSLGASGVVLRMLQLCFLRGPQWGLAWGLKILTDPFHNIAIYWRSPWVLLHGQRYDPLLDHEQSESAIGT